MSVKISDNTRASLIWGAMLLLTLAAYLIGVSGSSQQVLLTIVWLGMWLKGHWILNDYMGLAGAALVWRLVTHGWLFVVTGGILLAYLTSG